MKEEQQEPLLNEERPMTYNFGYRYIDDFGIEQTEWSTNSDYNAVAALNGERIAVSGIFDCPRRKSPTERSWDTSVEPFLQAADIVLDPRDISFCFVMKQTDNLSGFKQILIRCNVLQLNGNYYLVNCKDEISVTPIGNYNRIVVSFNEATPAIPVLSKVASAGGRISIDSYGLTPTFGIYYSSVSGINNSGARLEVNTTEPFDISTYRNKKEISVDCYMRASSIELLHGNMLQFQALLLKPLSRTLIIYQGNTQYHLPCYFKAGFKAQYMAEHVVKFVLKLSLIYD